MKKINLLKIDNLFVSKPTVLEEEYIKEYLNLDKIKNKELITLNVSNELLKWAGKFEI